jgi:hypothetical protein
VKPDLSGANFTSLAYDVYRRIGSVFRDSGGLFLESFCKDGVCNYLQPGVLETSFPPTTFTLVSGVIADFIPPTSRRARCLATAFNGGGGTLVVFAAHPDIGTGSSGGKQIVTAFPQLETGSTAADTNEFEIDLDNSQRFSIRQTGGVGSFTLWCVGYIEVL